ELAVQLSEELVRAVPENLDYRFRLADALYQLGQIRRVLEQHKTALDAYRRSAEVERTRFDRAPNVTEHREMLSWRYHRLAYWLSRPSPQQNLEEASKW